MARATMRREELVDKIGAVFRQYGYDGASLARLSEATGLMKPSLYYQFPNGKEDMARAVLAALDAEIGRLVAAPLADAALSPAQRLERMAAGLAEVYDDGRSFCLIDLFGIGEAGALFREHVARAVEGLSQALTAMLVGAGLPAADAALRAEDALIALQGSLVLSRATGKPAPFLRVLDEMPARLLAGSGKAAVDTLQ